MCLILRSRVPLVMTGETGEDAVMEEGATEAGAVMEVDVGMEETVAETAVEVDVVAETVVEVVVAEARDWTPTMQVHSHHFKAD